MDAPRSQGRALPAALLAPLVLICAGLVLNIAVGAVVRTVLRWPIYLDSIGTVLAGALGGPIAGAVTGALTNLVWGIVFDDPQIMPYALTAACIGLAAGIAAERNAFVSPGRAMVAGLLTGVIAALVSAPINAYIQAGATGGGNDTLVAFLETTGSNLLQAATLAGLLSDPVDKALTFLIAWAILRVLPLSLASRFAALRELARARRLNATWGLALAAIVVATVFAWVFLPAFGGTAFAVFYLAVVWTAWRAGLLPALAAIACGVLAMLLFPLPLFGGPGLTVGDALNLAIFVLVAGLITRFTVQRQRSTAALLAQKTSLEDREAQVSAVVDGVVEGLLLVDRAQCVRQVNHQFETLFGTPAAEVQDRPLAELKPLLSRVFEHPEILLERVAADADDQTSRFSETLTQQWPLERQLAVFGTPISTANGFLGHLYGFRDVTQEREQSTG